MLGSAPLMDNEVGELTVGQDSPHKLPSGARKTQERCLQVTFTVVAHQLA